jgi:hypothetical protein
MREEIVSSKEAEEHEVVNDLFAWLGIQHLAPIGILQHDWCGLGLGVLFEEVSNLLEVIRKKEGHVPELLVEVLAHHIDLFEQSISSQQEI